MDSLSGRVFCQEGALHPKITYHLPLMLLSTYTYPTLHLLLLPSYDTTLQFRRAENNRSYPAISWGVPVLIHPTRDTVMLHTRVPCFLAGYRSEVLFATMPLLCQNSRSPTINWVPFRRRADFCGFACVQHFASFVPLRAV